MTSFNYQLDQVPSRAIANHQVVQVLSRENTQVWQVPITIK